jgi:hypothetical protein
LYREPREVGEESDVFVGKAAAAAAAAAAQVKRHKPAAAAAAAAAAQVKRHKPAAARRQSAENKRESLLKKNWIPFPNPNPNTLF